MHGCTVWCKHRSCLMMNFSNYPFSTEEFEIDDSECDNWILHFFLLYSHPSPDRDLHMCDCVRIVIIHAKKKHPTELDGCSICKHFIRQLTIFF